jgi:hypothetical protein
MNTRTLISLWAIAITWAILWAALHFSRSASFPWVGALAGLFVVAPLLVLNWLEQRKARQREQREQHKQKPEEPRF